MEKLTWLNQHYMKEATPRALGETFKRYLPASYLEGESVPDLSRTLQDRVRSLIQEKVGVAEIKSVEVRIEEIVTQQKKEVVAEEPEPVPPPAGEVP